MINRFLAIKWYVLTISNIAKPQSSKSTLDLDSTVHKLSKLPKFHKKNLAVTKSSL